MEGFCTLSKENAMRKRILPIEFLDVPKPHKFAVCARKECL